MPIQRLDLKDNGDAGEIAEDALGDSAARDTPGNTTAISSPIEQETRPKPLHASRPVDLGLLNPRQRKIEYLSDELLLEIVDLTVDEEDTEPARYRLSILLSHICTRFRAIIVNKASFWKFVSTYFPLDMVQTFLQRSGSLPLRVELYIEAFATDSDDSRPRKAYELMQLHSERWGILCIRQTYQRVTHNLPLNLHLPVLDNLQILGNVTTDNITTWHMPALTELYSEVASVSVFRPSLNYYTGNFPVDCTPFSPTQDLSKAITGCQSLETLVLYISDSIFLLTHSTITLSATLPALTYLDLEMTLYPHNIQFFPSLPGMPNLVNLRLEVCEPPFGHGEGFGGFTEAFRGLLITCQKLKSFIFSYRRGEPEDDNGDPTSHIPFLDEAFQSMPALEELYVSASNLKLLAYDYITDMVGRNPFLQRPHFQRLMYDGCDQVNHEYLCGLARSLREVPAAWEALKTLTVYHIPGPAKIFDKSMNIVHDKVEELRALFQGKTIQISFLEDE